MLQPSTINLATSSAIACRKCKEKDHLTVQCPLRDPNDRAKAWTDIVSNYQKKQDAMPFQCSIAIHPGKRTHISAEDVTMFWNEIREAQSYSLYNQLTGIVNKSSGTFLPLDHSPVEAGKYVSVGRTTSLTNAELFEVLDNARDALREQLPLSQERVHSELLLLFNHFSLKHEGGSLGIDEIATIATCLDGKASKQEIHAADLDKLINDVPGSCHDITEAINHILVASKLQELAKRDVTETLILDLHKLVMDGILTNAEEGLAGEYRKVSINVMGSKHLRPNVADIPPLMARWCQRDLLQREDEHIIKYLSRIHSSFQDVHPFRDGNGRVGRLILNIILLKQGYPILVFAPSLSILFNQGVVHGLNSDYSIFSRLLAETLFASFQAYEDALKLRLLPESPIVPQDATE